MQYMEIGKSGIRSSVITFGGMGIGGGTWWRNSDDEESIRTLHRAFDLCADPFAALETARELGVGTILTSGQAASCLEGRELLAALCRAAGEMTILAGAGVNAAAIAELAKDTPLRAFHLSGKEVLDSGMRFRRDGVPMGLPGMSEYSLWRTSPAAVRAARRRKRSEKNGKRSEL